MNNSAASIRSALSTAMSAVTQLNDVKTGKTTVFSGFPAARIYLQGIENEQEDTASDFRTYRFSVDVLAPVKTENASVETLEGAFQDAIDAVLDKLGTQWTLSGNADNVQIQPSDVRLEEASFGPANLLPILVSVRTLITV